MGKVLLTPIGRDERSAFLGMAEEHFLGLDPCFTPHDDWKSSYFETIIATPEYCLRWVEVDDRRAGFVIFGVEKHRFLPRLTGNIFELYVTPQFRRKGIAREAASIAIRELWALGPSKIQLEVVEGNDGAASLWRGLGFQKVTERYVLSGTGK